MKGVQELYQQALKYAGELHHDQTVPGSKANYLLHISNVVMEVIMAYVSKPDFDLQFAVQVAILHDTVEDTEATIDDISKKFGSEVGEGVAALTKDDSIKDKNEKMVDSLARINKLRKEVGMVKIADRITNLQEPPSHWSAEKRSNYLAQAEMMAHELSNKNEYLNQRLLSKIEEYRTYI